MNQKKLVQNVIDQIKEAQIKLGYIKETVRLYYPVKTLNAMMGIRAKDEKEMLALFRETKWDVSPLPLVFSFSTDAGKRIEITVPADDAAYVHHEIETPPFLKDIIELFMYQHHAGISEICQVFEKYSRDYICEKMPEGSDFDYAVRFEDPSIDPYYYCIKMEMGHTIYHRFTKDDYLELLI